jgi:superfamily I DNA/RNA helicase
MSWWLDISDLDEDQKKVIDLPPTGNYLILGPPGSGKTNLLLIRAEYLIRTNQPNLYVLMFNEPLHDFVRRGGVNYDVPPNKVRKILSWEISLLREHGVSVEDLPEDDLWKKRKSIVEKISKLLEDQPRLCQHVECLLVDEIQDCLPEEVEVFLRCAKNVCFTGDSRQRIFSAQNVIPELQKRLITIELKTHYRIGHEICRAADVIGKTAGFESILNTCNYKGEKSRVDFFNCTSNEEQVKKIIESLAVQLKAYPDELLAVVGPRKIDSEFLRQKLSESSLSPFILEHRQSGSDDPSQRIYIAHLLEIKGLEFRTIHLALMEHVHRLGQNQKRITYTAITRAKTTVSIYFTGQIPGYLEQARVSVEPPKPKPSLSELFPNDKKGKK